MARVVLIEATPADPATGAAVTVRLAGGGSRPYTGYRGKADWRAGVAAAPRFTAEIGWDAGGWTGGATPTTGAIAFAPSLAATLELVAGLHWPGAALTLWSGDDAGAGEPAWRVELVARVAGLRIQGGALVLTIADLAGALSGAVAGGTFAGTGGAEGASAATGRVKRRSWGRVFNVEAQLLDAPSNVYEVGDPARPLQAIDVVRDRGRAGPVTVLAWQGSVDATLAALKAAQPPSGGAVVAPSIDCLKWWTAPSGPLTADLRGEVGAGYAENAAAIAAALVAAAAGGALAVTNVAVAAGWRPATAGLHVGDAGETGAQALTRLLLGVSLTWSVATAGGVELLDLASAAPVETVRIVGAVEREAAYPPLSPRRLGYARNHRVMSDGEISAAVPAGDVVYDDGKTVADLKPATGGADKTADTPQGQAAAAGLNADGTVKSGKVATASIAPGQVTALTALAYPDVQVSSAETLVLEQRGIVIGDEADGRATVRYSYLQDSLTVRDTGIRLRILVDAGSGYQEAYNRVHGLRTDGGDTYWAFPLSVEVPVYGAAVSIKVTAQGVQIAGGGQNAGSWVRNSALSIFSGAR